MLALLAALALQAQAPDPGHLAELRERARRAGLAADTGWLRLGHWRPRLLGGVRSEADGDAFFLAPEGRSDPVAELDATLAALFDASPKGDELEDAQCRFPARFAFLGARLAVDPARLPPRPCPRLEAFRSRVGATGVTLVFSAWYLDNPSSAFGHTFLRLDRAGPERGGRDADLLDYGVDYAARVDTANSLVYAIKGLLGRFEGRFSHYPYYYKVRQYAEYESRDLWEYALALSREEVALLVDHLWELDGARFDYWYLDENCSYHVLGAIEAAAPRLHLLAHVDGLVVLPSDTVKALFLNEGLVRRVEHRPSLRRQLDARLARLDDGERGRAATLAEDPDAPLPLPPARQAAVLDAALDLVDFRSGRAILHGTDAAAAAVRQGLLVRRSGVPVQGTRLALPPPREGRPELGHPALRAGAGAGATARAGPVALLDFRRALHDLGDPPAGYPPFAQLEFLPVRAALSLRDGRLAALEASLFRVTSLNAPSRVDPRPSWRARLGADLLADGGCDRCVAAVAELGGGVSALSLGGRLDLYAGADGAVDGAPRLDGIGGGPVRLGAGPAALARLRLGERFSLVASGRWRWLPFTALHATGSAGAEARLHLAPRLSVAATARVDPSDWLAGVMFLGYL